MSWEKEGRGGVAPGVLGISTEEQKQEQEQGSRPRLTKPPRCDSSGRPALTRGSHSRVPPPNGAAKGAHPIDIKVGVIDAYA